MRIVYLLPFCLILTACQTTGAIPVNNQVIPYGITPADSQMDCTQLQAEFNRMDQIIAGSSSQNNNSQMTQIGTQVAQSAMSSAGYGQHGGILGSLGTIANQMAGAGQQSKQQQAQAAQVRREQLLNLAYQKGCIR